jgi:hypothetical protein
MSSVTNKLRRYAEDGHLGDWMMQVIIYGGKPLIPQGMASKLADPPSFKPRESPRSVIKKSVTQAFKFKPFRQEFS